MKARLLVATGRVGGDSTDQVFRLR